MGQFQEGELALKNPSVSLEHCLHVFFGHFEVVRPFRVRQSVPDASCSLELKGTMSEAELHVLRARLQGGIRDKARRGELEIRPPVGLVYNSERVLILDPDKQVQQSLRLLFETFRQRGSALATVKAFRQQGLLFPRRLHSGPQQGELLWARLEHSKVLSILHNPRYTGAFVYGRTRTRKTVTGRITIEPIPRPQWDTFIPAQRLRLLGAV